MADIILKDRDGNDEVYTDIEAVKFNTSDGGTVTFIKGEKVTKSVDLDFSEGDMVVTPEEGFVFNEIAIPKPTNLIPENIAKDVEVAGIVGVHEGGGGGEFDSSEEMLKYFTYQIDVEKKTITLFEILFKTIYADTGTYEVTIPNQLGGYNVVVMNEK